MPAPEEDLVPEVEVKEADKESQAEINQEVLAQLKLIKEEMQNLESKNKQLSTLMVNLTTVLNVTLGDEGSGVESLLKETTELLGKML